MGSFYSYDEIVMRDKEVENSVCFLISVFPKFLKSDLTLLAGRNVAF